MDGSEVSTVTMWILGDPLVAGERFAQNPHAENTVIFGSFAA